MGIAALTPKKALNNLDSKLEKYLDYKNGFFIEAGGNDGERQSNTYYLEFGKRWRGLIVEPIPELYRKCRAIRKRAIVCNRALVSPDYKDPTLTLHYANLMSVGEGVMPPEEVKAHIKSGLECQKIAKSYKVDVPAVTLASLLDQYNVSDIDFLSLDIEGAELEALKGLNLNKYRPKWILIEAGAKRFNDVDHFLRMNGYTQLEKMSHHDFLYKDKERVLLKKDRQMGREALSLGNEWSKM